MRARTWLILSLGANTVLAAGWYFATRPTGIPMKEPVPSEATNGPNYRPRTSVLVRPQYFTWQQVESADYVTYVRNLRSIGCPEQTIRDIIVADVNQLYAHRRATEILSAESQWWRSDPDTNLLSTAVAKARELDEERKTLLTKLLGAGWDHDPSALPPAVRAVVSLTGPILGDLPAETKESVFKLAVKSQEKIDAYIEAQRLQNKPVDPVELARLREESRTQLAALLKPEQMEEFLLRYSQTARELREELRGLEVTPDEFRALFKARDPIDSQADLYYAGNDPAALKKKRELEAKRDEAIKLALSPQRYAEYQLNQDPLFRQAKATAQSFGAPAESVLPMYEIDRLTQAELERIRNDATLSNEEKVEALADAEVDYQKALEKVMGPEAFQRWLMRKKP